MSKLMVGKGLFPETKIWRYMSLDKLINLLSSKTLYFSTLSSYTKSDPFEGLYPRVVLDNTAEIIKNLSSQHIAAIIRKSDRSLNKEELSIINKNNTGVEELNEQTFFKIMELFTVCCWHENEFESEGMWKIYSELNKGVVIQTTIQRLEESINYNEDIYADRVKYIDYYKPDLTLDECKVGEILAPLLKRKSFEHEKEVRLYIPYKITDPNPFNLLAKKPEAIKVPIEPLKLIEKILISPYSDELFTGSVQSVVASFGLDKIRVKKSKLLDDDVNLRKLFPM